MKYRLNELKSEFPLRKIIRELERTRKFFFVLKSLVPTQSPQDKENFSCLFQSTDNSPEWKLAFKGESVSTRENYPWFGTDKKIFLCVNAISSNPELTRQRKLFLSVPIHG
jgi:hypothetical protein